ncbi:hypothetical protein ACTA71_002896 [Dictyostelium dimigraforme]
MEIPQGKREILKKLPLVGNVRIEKLTVNFINFIGFFIIIVSSVILRVRRNGSKLKYLELLITIIGGIGFNINRQILEKIKQYKDIIYESNWFLIRKLYTIGEKKVIMIQKIKEYCSTHKLPYKQDYENVISKKLEKVGIEEIPLLVKQELTNLTKKVVTESSSVPANYIVNAGLVILICLFGYYIYTEYFDEVDEKTQRVIDFIENHRAQAKISEVMNFRTLEMLNNHTGPHRFGLKALIPVDRLSILPLPIPKYGNVLLGDVETMTKVTEGAVKIMENIT